MKQAVMSEQERQDWGAFYVKLHRLANRVRAQQAAEQQAQTEEKPNHESAGNANDSAPGRRG